MKTKLTLYRVTLDWDRNDAEQGDYCSNVWAVDQQAAIKAIAGEMSDGQLLKGKERRKAIAEWSTCGQGCAEDVLGMVRNHVRDLMGGPKNDGLSNMQMSAYGVIFDLLDLHGAAR